MNKIDTLIETLCPDGLVYQHLDDVCSTFSGSFVKKTEQDDSYQYPVYNGGAKPTGYYNTYNSSANSVAISARGSIGFVNWVDQPFYAGNSCHVIVSKDVRLDTRFLFHYLKHHEPELYAERNIGSIPALNLKPVLKFLLPIPPLKIQQEIVGILDKFLKLEAELEAELEARKKQGVHYRDFLLSDNYMSGGLCPDGLVYQHLGDVCSTFSGSFVKKTEQDDSYQYPVYNGGAKPTGYYNTYNSSANSVAISARGSIGFVNWVDQPFYAGNSCHVIVSKDVRLDTRFLFHYLKHHEPELYAERNIGSIPALNLKPVLKFLLPIPPLKIQQEIVGILDKFLKLEAELEAELEARKKQGVHYRNKLLTFKEMEVA